MFNIPFPGGAKDGDVFFHKDNACYYHEELNTWECRKVDTSTVNDPNYLTTADVYTLNVRPTFVENPFSLTDDPNTVVTQQEANWWLLENLVKKQGGDTMEGQLIINGPRKAGDDVDNPKLVSSLKVLNIDNAQNSSLQLRHSGNAKVYIGDTDISVASDIKFNRAAGSVVKTNVQDLLNIGESRDCLLRSKH